MNPYCFNENELQAFIEIALFGREIYDDEEEFNCLLEGWRVWETEFICLATVFSRFLEKQLRLDEDAHRVLPEILAIYNKTGLWLTIEGFGEDFVKYFLHQSRNTDLTIAEDLNHLRIQFGEYEY